MSTGFLAPNVAISSLNHFFVRFANSFSFFHGANHLHRKGIYLGTQVISPVARPFLVLWLRSWVSLAVCQLLYRCKTFYFSAILRTIPQSPEISGHGSGSLGLFSDHSSNYLQHLRTITGMSWRTDRGYHHWTRFRVYGLVSRRRARQRRETNFQPPWNHILSCLSFEWLWGAHVQR